MDTHAKANPHSHVHIPTVRILVLVFVALITGTALTAEVATINLGEWNIVVAMAIACTKATLVAWVFMGVRFTSQLTKLFCVAGLVFLSILLLITFSDYSTRGWTYHAKTWAGNKSEGESKSWPADKITSTTK
jgi:cytochrome c oxidase subunit 4